MDKGVAGLAAVLALALLAGPAAAESGVVIVNPGQEETVATMSLGRGDVVEYAYSAGLDIEFRIARDGTEVFSSGAMGTTGTFTAAEAGTYVFSFQNHGPNMMPVSYDLKKRPDVTPYLIGGGIAAGAGAGIGGFALWRKKAKGAQAPRATPPPP